MNTFDAILRAPWGAIGLRADGARLTAIHYLPPAARLRPPRSALLKETARQLEAYLHDANTVFDLPLALEGSTFRHAVWAAICAIPRGATTTYGAIAAAIGGMPRAVGQACGDNPFPIVIPCHRVVGQKGLGGFAHDPESAGGFHSEVKRWLLVHEGVLLL